MAKSARVQPHPSGSRPERVADADADFYAWTRDQAGRLRVGDLGALDLLRLAEEIEAVGNEVYARFESALAVLMQHLLKWDHQPERRSRSWVNTIREQRRRIDTLLTANPSLKARWREAVAAAYLDAKDRASTELDRPVRSFPADCPYDAAALRTRVIAWDDE